MSTVLRRIDTNARENLLTPEKSLRKQFNTQENRSAKKYRAADFLDVALKHERSGNKELALSAYEDAAENISNNMKILAKIEQLKSQINEEYESKAAQKKQALLQQQQEEEEAARRRHQEEILRTREEDERDFYDTEGEVSMMTEDNDTLFYDDETTASTLYSEYDPEKRAAILQQLQTKTQSALEYQLLDRLNKGDKEELLQLKQIGNIRATGILKLREEFADDNASGDGLYFKSLEQLEDIYMKPKEIKSFLRQNAVFLLGL